MGGCGSVGASVGGLWVARHGLNVLNVDASAVGAGLLLLELQLELEDFNFLLLTQDGELGLAGRGALGFSLLLLAVEDEASDEVPADADELGLSGVVAIESVFVGLPGASVAAVAPGEACLEAETLISATDVIGIAGAIETEVTGVSGRSGDGGGGGAGEKSSGGESFEGHGREVCEREQGMNP